MRVPDGLTLLGCSFQESIFMQPKPDMEGDHPSPEDPKQAASDDRSGSSSSIRTYYCTFCKRGFSNAQALGGHMNIHRRDRAKMRQLPSNLGRLPVDISSKRVPSCSPSSTSYAAQLAQGGDDIGGLFKGPRILPTQRDIHEDETHEARQQLLPLFLEAPLQGADGPSRSAVERPEEEASGSGAAAVELDLELRLGPEPPHETMGCKEFV